MVVILEIKLASKELALLKPETLLKVFHKLSKVSIFTDITGTSFLDQMHLKPSTNRWLYRISSSLQKFGLYLD